MLPGTQSKRNKDFSLLEQTEHKHSARKRAVPEPTSNFLPISSFGQVSNFKETICCGLTPLGSTMQLLHSGMAESESESYKWENSWAEIKMVKQKDTCVYKALPRQIALIEILTLPLTGEYLYYSASPCEDFKEFKTQCPMHGGLKQRIS